MDIKEMLGEELFEQVKEKVGDKKLIVNDGNYIPKAKFDELNTTKQDYKTQLEERDAQLEELKKKATGNEDLSKQIEELQAANLTVMEDYEQKLKEQQLNLTVENELLKAKAKNPKAVRALLDLAKIEIADGEVKGLADQIKDLKEKEAYLFGEEKQGNAGANPPPDPKKTARDDYNDLMKLARENPNDMSIKQRLFLAKTKLKE